jgi:hypothetical protein
MGKIYKRDGTWHFYYLGVDGKRVRRSSHTSDEKAALAMLAEAEGQVALEKKARHEKAAAGMGQAADQTISGAHRATRKCGAAAGPAPPFRVRDLTTLGSDRDQLTRCGLKAETSAPTASASIWRRRFAEQARLRMAARFRLLGEPRRAHGTAIVSIRRRPGDGEQQDVALSEHGHVAAPVGGLRTNAPLRRTLPASLVSPRVARATLRPRP